MQNALERAGEPFLLSAKDRKRVRTRVRTTPHPPLLLDHAQGESETRVANLLGVFPSRQRPEGALRVGLLYSASSSSRGRSVEGTRAAVSYGRVAVRHP